MFTDKEGDGSSKAAETIAQMIGRLFVLIKEAVSNPCSWISNLGAAIFDGIKNHLDSAMMIALSAWRGEQSP
jgi:hypothetical protein